VTGTILHAVLPPAAADHRRVLDVLPSFGLTSDPRCGCGRRHASVPRGSSGPG